MPAETIWKRPGTRSSARDAPLDRVGRQVERRSRRRRRRGCCRRSAGRRAATASPAGRAASRPRTPALRATTESAVARTSAGVIDRRRSSTRGSARGELGAARIVDVDDRRRAGRQHLEQPALGREVLLHVAVKIEMIAREVREDRRRRSARWRRAAARARATTLPSRRPCSRGRPSRAAAAGPRTPPASCATRRARRRRPARRGTSPCRAGRTACPAASKTDASRYVVVVLPFVPVTPTTVERFARAAVDRCAASSASASRASVRAQPGHG